MYNMTFDIEKRKYCLFRIEISLLKILLSKHDKASFGKYVPKRLIELEKTQSQWFLVNK